MKGHRWLAFDVDFLDNPFTIRLGNRFGTAGVVVWVAFLCACKRSPTPGVVRYTSDAHLRRELGILTVPLVDAAGKEWSLDDLWTWTGQQKQTSRRRHGGRTHLSSTRWERWQQDAQTHANTQRMADKRRAHNAHTTRTSRAQNGLDIDIDKDIPPKSPTSEDGRGTSTPTSGGDPQGTRANGKNPRALGTNPRTVTVRTAADQRFAATAAYVEQFDALPKPEDGPERIAELRARLGRGEPHAAGEAG